MDIVVYSMGKVGTQSVEAAIRAAGLKVFRTHFLAKKEVDAVCAYVKAHYEAGTWDTLLQSRIDQMAETLRLHQHLLASNDVRLICGFRDPIQLAISSYFETFEQTRQDWIREFWEYPSNLLSQIYDDVHSTVSAPNFGLQWFDDELRSYTGFDAFSHPFDKEKGCSIYEHGKYRILIFRYEGFPDHVEPYLRDFLETNDVSIAEVNRAKNKRINFLYNIARSKFKFDYDLINSIYSSEKLRHLYDENTVNYFIEKWGSTDTVKLDLSVDDYINNIYSMLVSQSDIEMIANRIKNISEAGTDILSKIRDNNYRTVKYASFPKNYISYLLLRLITDGLLDRDCLVEFTKNFAIPSKIVVFLILHFCDPEDIVALSSWALTAYSTSHKAAELDDQVFGHIESQAS